MMTEEDDDEDDLAVYKDNVAKTQEPKKKQKKPKSKKKNQIGKRYPSQYIKVGEIHCIFLSCYYKGQSPLLTIGPSWPFTLFLLGLAAIILGYFYMMILLGSRANPYYRLWCQFCVVLNFAVLWGGILKNPGIPQRYIDRILKEQQGKGEDEDDGEVEMKDLETGATGTAKKENKHLDSAKKGLVWCQICMIETEQDSYHCEDCDVCIEEYDHHCVFFSKCIGGGNIYCFWGALGGVLFNFVNIAIMLGVTAAIHGSVQSDEERKNIINSAAKTIRDNLSGQLAHPGI